jgi:rod shape determining protein RodA
MVVRGLRRFDPWLIGVSVLLALYGMALIYSGSLPQFDRSTAAVLEGPITRQVIFLVAGLGLMVVFARLDYRLWNAFSPALYAAALATLVFVLFFGTSEYGSRRWIPVFGTPLQPSEPAKLLTILLLAKLLAAGSTGKGLSGRAFLLTLGVAAVPALLVFKQPDLGTAVVFLAVWLGMAFMAGARLRHLGLLASAVLIALPFLLLAAVHDYQLKRLEIFFAPNADPLGANFNINQAAIAVGSGGMVGKGLTHGTQTQYEFLRTQTTDYIFSVLGEELGFIGAMVLFALFVLLMVRGLHVAAVAQDDGGRLVATGIVVMILTQVFINVGVNIRLFPVTGIPLPFISQGGSSLLTMLMSVGILQSILARRRPPGAGRTVDRLLWQR